MVEGTNRSGTGWVIHTLIFVQPHPPLTLVFYNFQYARSLKETESQMSSENSVDLIEVCKGLSTQTLGLPPDHHIFCPRHDAASKNMPTKHQQPGAWLTGRRTCPANWLLDCNKVANIRKMTATLKTLNSLHFFASRSLQDPYLTPGQQVKEAHSLCGASRTAKQ